MLSSTANQRTFWGLYSTLIIIQLFLAEHTDLFGDEAFYWLEGQFWQWSYSEIPGFVPWLNAISTAWLPQHPLFLRLPYLLAGWSIPWLSIMLAKLLSQNQQTDWTVPLLSLSLPLLGLMGVLAIADVWLVVFTLLAVIFWLRLMQDNRYRNAIYLGFVLMLGINLHIRFWFVLALAILVAAVVYKQAFMKQRSLWLITLPLVAIGFMPILLFNLENNFPLIGFQLGERNPWQFQLSHFWFFVVQIVITTPWVILLCLMTLRSPWSLTGKSRLAVLFIQYLAVSYWLLYALLGFFSDNLRTNIHWPLPAYLLLLILAASQTERFQSLKKWAVWSGGLAHVAFLMGLYALIHVIPVDSNPHKQLISNAIGWRQLATKTDELKQTSQTLLADQFMTAAALNYHQPNQGNRFIPVLNHPLNQKHGRQTQLELMDLLYKETPKKTALLVVEHTALKLSQQIPFYQHSCQQLNGLRLIDQLSIRSGAKLYYFFHTNAGDCDIPPIVYHDYDQGVHRGWMVVNRDSKTQLMMITSPHTSPQKPVVSARPLGQNELFQNISADRYQLLKYEFDYAGSVQLNVRHTQKTWLTQRFFP